MPRPKKTSQVTTASEQSPEQSAALGARVDEELSISAKKPRKPKRPPRIPMNAGMNLHIPKKLLNHNKFAYRWFAESSIKGGRIEIAKGAYWEHVADSNGSNYKRPSATDTMYLMKLELEYWEADRKAKRHKVKLTMEKEIAIGEGEYAPSRDGKAEGGTSAITRW